MKNRLVFSLILCGLPLIPIVYFFFDLPDQMAVHVTNGTPDIYLNKYLATFGIIVFCMVVQILDYETKYKNASESNLFFHLVHLLTMPILTNLVMLNILNLSLRSKLFTFGSTRIIGIFLIAMSLSILISKRNFMFPNQWIKSKKKLSISVTRTSAVLYFCSGVLMMFVKMSVVLQLIILITLLVLPRLVQLGFRNS
ncbi:DUF1648 domain-containing protein [Enterococcus sp. LJL90]